MLEKNLPSRPIPAFDPSLFVGRCLPEKGVVAGGSPASPPDPPSFLRSSVMPIGVVCRSCDRSIKVKDDLAGRRVKCPGCGKLLAIPDEEVDDRPLRKRDRDREEEENDRPRRRNGNERSKRGLIIGLSLGGGVLVVGLTVLLIVLLGSRDNPNVTEENFDKIKPCMSQEEVEKILGKGEKVSYNAVNEALHARPSKNPSTGNAQTYRWKNKSDTILLVIAPSRGAPGKGVGIGWFVREQKQGQPKHKGLGFGKLE